MGKIYINKKEYDALWDAYGYVSNLLEGCWADETTKEGKEALDLLQLTLDGLNSIIEKYKNT